MGFPIPTSLAAATRIVFLATGLPRFRRQYLMEEPDLVMLPIQDSLD